MENVLVKEQYLKDVAEAIRAKNETDNTYTPGEMAAAIGELKTDFVTEPLEVTENGVYTPGDGVDGFNKVTVDIESSGVELPPEAFEISGDASYKFAYTAWNWYIDALSDKITTKDLSEANYMFYYNTDIEEIPFELNFSYPDDIVTSDIENMFSNCKKLKTVPKFNNCRVKNRNNLFSNCSALEEIPSDFASGFDWSYTDNLTNGSYLAGAKEMFNGCSSLRSIPMDFIAHNNRVINYSYCTYYGAFTGCTVLDELVNLPVICRDAKWTSNAFYNTFKNCGRLKDMIFETQEDGTPYEAKWKGQTIDLTTVGYYGSLKFIEGKQVTNDETYQALKNDPDWWTTAVAYSRYNHDSAVRTINSLPDTSAYLATAGGTNTIKFSKKGGMSTDGGAAELLTEEEIAVATAKGWTVSV